jgi:hypothetical protein
MNRNNDLELWRKTEAVCRECLKLDREMLASLGPMDQERERDPENYVDPGLWEQFIAARQDLVDFTTSSIDILASKGRNTALSEGADRKTATEQGELETRLINSLREMVELEFKLTNYLSENLDVLKETIDGLNKNQVIFSHYAKMATKPDPGYLNSDI